MLIFHFAPFTRCSGACQLFSFLMYSVSMMLQYLFAGWRLRLCAICLVYVTWGCFARALLVVCVEGLVMAHTELSTSSCVMWVTSSSSVFSGHDSWCALRVWMYFLWLGHTCCLKYFAVHPSSIRRFRQVSSLRSSMTHAFMLLTSCMSCIALKPSIITTSTALHALSAAVRILSCAIDSGRSQTFVFFVYASSKNRSWCIRRTLTPFDFILAFSCLASVVLPACVGPDIPMICALEFCLCVDVLLSC